LGIEKMTDATSDDVTAGLMAAGTDEERLSGVTFPGIYALMAREYMHEYGVTEEQLCGTPVKNHFHGTHNPKAQFRYPVSVSDVLKSSKIADPLKLLDCSPVSDGASAIIISGKSDGGNRSIRIIASEVATDSVGLCDRETLVSLPAVVRAGEKAYRSAGIMPSDVDVSEVHDCFSIAEIIATEDLGLSQRGKAAVDILEGKMTLGQSKGVVTNPSGGLKACGHPVGATGIKQIVELSQQLAGTCEARQVEGAKIGLAHNVGGSGAVAVIHILTNNI
jgi:acetyl-CoA C-acetyltransferase